MAFLPYLLEEGSADPRRRSTLAVHSGEGPDPDPQYFGG
jgi:hypothetical protein